MRITAFGAAETANPSREAITPAVASARRTWRTPTSRPSCTCTGVCASSRRSNRRTRKLAARLASADLVIIQAEESPTPAFQTCHPRCTQRLPSFVHTFIMNSAIDSSDILATTASLHVSGGVLCRSCRDLRDPATCSRDSILRDVDACCAFGNRFFRKMKV